MGDYLEQIEDYLSTDDSMRPAVFDLYLRVEQVKASRRIALALEELDLSPLAVTTSGPIHWVDPTLFEGDGIPTTAGTGVEIQGDTAPEGEL